MTSLGNMKVSVQLVDLFFNLEQCPKGYVYAYPLDQTRLFKAVEKFGEEPVIKTLLNKINNVYGEKGFYLYNQAPVDPAKPLTFVYVPNDQA